MIGNVSVHVNTMQMKCDMYVNIHKCISCKVSFDPIPADKHRVEMNFSIDYKFAPKRCTINMICKWVTHILEKTASGPYRGFPICAYCPKSFSDLWRSSGANLFPFDMHTYTIFYTPLSHIFDEIYLMPQVLLRLRTLKCCRAINWLENCYHYFGRFTFDWVEWKRQIGELWTGRAGYS